MDSNKKRPLAMDPQDLARFFLERANAGDVDGLAELYEPEAILVDAQGRQMVGMEEIRNFYAGLISTGMKFRAGEQRPAVRNGRLALTSTRLVSGFVTAEVARQQPDGSWRWIIDQPAIAREVTA